jgi:hypothetical protein
MKTLSRRNFVAGTVAAGALGALTAGAAFAAAPAPMPESWDYEADFVVLGAGAAGVMAAVGASEGGASVIILEKCPIETAGGATSVAAGIVSVFNDEENPASAWFPYRTVGYKSAETGQKVGNCLPAVLDMLEAKGMGWVGDERPVSGSGVIAGHGPALYEAMLACLADTDTQVMYERPATDLIVDPATGSVVGVYADQGGQAVAVKAAKGVLIATGSYASNPDLVNSLDMPGIEYFSQDSPTNTGDGLIMGATIGAALMGFYSSIEPDTPSIKAASEYANTSVGIAKGFNCPSEIWVNRDANRFTNEDVQIMHNKDIIMPYLAHKKRNPNPGEDGYAVAQECYVNLPFWMVFDHACFESGSIGNTNWEWTWARFKSEEEGGYLWSEDNTVELDRGWIMQADTIEELAEQMGVDPDALAQTVASYNADCAAGEDTAFGRNATELVPLENGPFYAVELAPTVLFTTGGLRSNEDFEVVRWDGEAIGNLYVTGNAGMDMFVSPGLLTVLASGYAIGKDIAAR